MMISVVVNNYNYSKFLKDCITSVLEQTYHDFQLIIVDDGSVDSSATIINGFKDKRIVFIQKSNGGQLSCFNAAIPYIKGDIVAFLDSDDILLSEYLEKISQLYERTNADYIFTNYHRFGAINELYVKPSRSIFFPASKLLTYVSHCWIGGPTSTLSMRTKILKSFLPLYEIEAAWRTRADDILVWGASLYGATKFYFHEALVRYRVHGNNHFYGREIPPEKLHDREINVKFFFNTFSAIENDISTKNMLSEMHQACLPVRYYLPYIFRNKFVRKILRPIDSFCRYRRDEYSALIL